MSEALSDKRLEAAAQIQAGYFNGHSAAVEYARRIIEPKSALSMLRAAIRQTHADELAACLEYVLELVPEPKFSSDLEMINASRREIARLKALTDEVQP